MKTSKTIPNPRRVPSALPFLLAALCPGACSFKPAPVIQYRAESPGATWDRGTEYHLSRTGALDIRTGFLEYSNDYVLGYEGPHPLFFQITAENRSAKNVLFDPGDFRIQIPCRDSVMAAIDPEAVIHRARTEQAAEDARYAGRAATLAGLKLGDAILDIATMFATKDPKQEREWEESKEQTRQMQEDEENRHRDRTAEITTRKTFWSDSTLRKTTLPPGGSMRGRIGFAMEPHSAPSDSLLLQYREADGRHVDLITYGLIPDQPSAVAAAPIHSGPAPPDSASKASGSGSTRVGRDSQADQDPAWRRAPGAPQGRSAIPGL